MKQQLVLQMSILENLKNTNKKITERDVQQACEEFWKMERNFTIRKNYIITIFGCLDVQHKEITKKTGRFCLFKNDEQFFFSDVGFSSTLKEHTF